MAVEFPSAEELLDKATNLFKKEFNSTPHVAACAPEVIHLFGEYTDYTEELSILIAVEIMTVIVGHINHSEYISVVSTIDESNPKISFIATDLSPGHPSWGNYIKGAIKHFPDAVPGFNALIVTSMQSGSQLPTGASLLVATYTFLEALMNFYAINPIVKALTCQKAEKEYCEIPSGISATISSIFGEYRKALSVDSRSLEYRLLALDNYNITFMMLKSDILNHIRLGDPQAHTTQWNDVSKTIGKKSLRDVTSKELLDSQKTLDPVIFTRAKYVISANERVIAAEKALENKDYPYFGKLMVETHRSLRNNYEVSCEDVDQLMETVLQYGENQQDSVLGALLNCTIGCIVIMINKSAMNGFIEHIWTKFKEKTPKFYVLRPSYGARVLRTPFRKNFI